MIKNHVCATIAIVKIGVLKLGDNCSFIEI